MKKFYGNVLGGFTALMAGLLTLVTPASAKIFFVTETNDSTAITSLRGAVIAANSLGGDNTIILTRQDDQRLRPLNPWNYCLTIQGGDEDAAQTGDLNIVRGSLTIVGGASHITIDASKLSDRAFRVMPNAKLLLLNVTITGGTAASSTEGGGAVYNSGNLGIENCMFANNLGGPCGTDLTAQGHGGAIYNEGALFIVNSVFTNNAAGSAAQGGAIYNKGSATLIQCNISSNFAGAGFDSSSDLFIGVEGGNGGGLCNLQTMVLDHCFISGNAAGAAGTSSFGNDGVGVPEFFGGDGGSGGGIWNTGSLTAFACTVSGNLCGDGGDGGNGFWGGMAGTGGDGAGLLNSGVANLNSCTISGNFCGTGGNGGNGLFDIGGDGAAGGSGGGIYNSGSLKLTSCTIAVNQTGMGGNGGNGGEFTTTAATGGQSGDGGGIFNALSSSNASVRNTLIALNNSNLGGLAGTNLTEFGEIIGHAGSMEAGFDLAGIFTSQGYNLIGTADDSFGFTNALTGDQVGTDANPINPLLGPLSFNGGLTPTHPLLSGSPAIDAGNSFGTRFDQRGFLRPYNDSTVPNAQGSDGTDIGAFELEPKILSPARQR